MPTFRTFPVDHDVEIDPSDIRVAQSGIEMDDVSNRPVPNQPETVILAFKDGRDPVRIVGTVKEMFALMQQAERASLPAPPVRLD